MSQHSHIEHEHSLRAELICHLPYATFSVAFSFIIVGLLQFCGASPLVEESYIESCYHTLFHLLHYVHILFATVGTIVTFARFSSNKVSAFFIGLFSPALFCTLSDVALPALAGNLLGIEMNMHICFFSAHDLINVIPFMVAGIVTGFSIAHHKPAELQTFSLKSHFVHILISSLAASCYVMSYGFAEWSHLMGLLFFLLIGAVVVPCTISDVVVPIAVAHWKRLL